MCGVTVDLKGEITSMSVHIFLLLGLLLVLRRMQM